jgi:hypothetical protein
MRSDKHPAPGGKPEHSFSNAIQQLISDPSEKVIRIIQIGPDVLTDLYSALPLPYAKIKSHLQLLLELALQIPNLFTKVKAIDFSLQKSL